MKEIKNQINSLRNELKNPVLRASAPVLELPSPGAASKIQVVLEPVLEPVVLEPVLDTISGRTASNTKYYKAALGAAKCPEDTHIIDNAQDCYVAMRDWLGNGGNFAWSGNYVGVPNGCSVNNNNEVHFNYSKSGRGRSDLMPICHNPSITEPEPEPVFETKRGTTTGNNVTDREIDRIDRELNRIDTRMMSMYNNLLAAMDSQTRTVNSILNNIDEIKKTYGQLKSDYDYTHGSVVSLCSAVRRGACPREFPQG